MFHISKAMVIYTHALARPVLARTLSQPNNKTDFSEHFPCLEEVSLCILDIWI